MPEPGRGTVHIPVLREEVLETLNPSEGESILDLTVGAGGHAEAVLPRLGEQGLLVGVDRDEEILKIAAARLGVPTVRLIRGNFGNLVELRRILPRPTYDGILVDLGVSSLQLDDAARGFSFRRDGPLDMRMTRDAPVTAREIVNEWSVEQLTEILTSYGEEPYAERVARAIVKGRARKPIETTGELAEIVRPAAARRSTSRGGTKVDAVTRTFQGLRLAVNRELEALDELLARFDPMLAPGGRFVVISYHSLEDRRTKNAFRQRAKEGYELLTPRPVRPSAAEIAANPRARSARLRALRKPDREVA